MDMRASQMLLAFSAFMAIGGAVASGCGASTSGSTPVEAGTDTSTGGHEAGPTPEAGGHEAAAESGGPVDAAQEKPVCVPVDADLTTLPIPDSGLPDGGFDVGQCVSCLRANCHSQLEACNADCVCIDAIVNCLATGQISLTCLPAGALNDPALLGLGACVVGPTAPCTAACGQAKADSGSSSGGGDGATE
jgi:hypothetical protein